MLGFSEIVIADFEFSVLPGERPRPVCLVAHELVSGRKIRYFEEQLHSLNAAPYATGRDVLFVAYYAPAEMLCHLVLGWSRPSNILDLYAEFRNLTNGLAPLCGDNLLGAMVHYGLDGITVAQKDSMRALVLRGGPWNGDERRQLLDYCESDVVGTSQLFGRMIPQVDLPRALVRGRYLAAVARMEYLGVPLDSKMLSALRKHWAPIKMRLIERINVKYGVYDGQTFKADRFAHWLASNNIPWPRLESGHLALDDDSFREMARLYPEIMPIRDTRYALSKMRLEDLTVGTDGRNRCMLSAFRARTGRNQPSNAKFIFGPAVWLRHLIRPDIGNGLAYLDWSQQEFGIGAALSGDPAMIEAYVSGDPYLTFAKQAGAVPTGATKESHGDERNLFKACALGVQYGIGAESLARNIGQTLAQGRELLRKHRETYPEYWRWSDAAVDRAMLLGSLYTAFGWTIHTGHDVNPRSLRNFPMQGNGAEMLRLACCFATERDVKVCAPVHDAILIEAPDEELPAAVHAAQEAMADASALVLNGFQLRSEAKLIYFPDRYKDERGEEMWRAVCGALEQLRTQSLSNISSSFIYVPSETPNTLTTPDTPKVADTSDASDVPDTQTTSHAPETDNSREARGLAEQAAHKVCA